MYSGWGKMTLVIYSGLGKTERSETKQSHGFFKTESMELQVTKFKFSTTNCRQANQRCGLASFWFQAPFRDKTEVHACKLGHPVDDRASHGTCFDGMTELQEQVMAEPNLRAASSASECGQSGHGFSIYIIHQCCSIYLF